MTHIEVNDPNRITIYNALSAKLKRRELRENRANGEWQEPIDELNYAVLGLLGLKKEYSYIQIDNRPTFWFSLNTRLDNQDGYIIHKNITRVNIKGHRVKVYYDGQIQKYRFDTKMQFYVKMRTSKSWTLKK